jgi:phosphatidylglycerophosphate synthase
MDTIPVRGRVAAPYRFVLALLERFINLPNINPALYQLLAIGLSIAYLYLENLWLKAAVIMVILICDWLDGATARRHRTLSRAGYIADATIDRASEGLIFVGEAMHGAGQLFFLLWLVNCGLTFHSSRGNRHRALPLRFLYVLVLVGQAMGYW